MATGIKKLKDLELRWTNSIHKEAGAYLEIVKWQREPTPHCFTLAFWLRNKEGWDLQYVGARPFEYENQELFFDLSRYGQAVLDADFDLTQKHGITYD